MLLFLLSLVSVALAQCVGQAGVIVIPSTTTPVELCSVSKNCPAVSTCSAAGQAGQSKAVQSLLFGCLFFLLHRSLFSCSARRDLACAMPRCVISVMHADNFFCSATTCGSITFTCVTPSATAPNWSRVSFCSTAQVGTAPVCDFSLLTTDSVADVHASGGCCRALPPHRLGAVEWHRQPQAVLWRVSPDNVLQLWSQQCRRGRVVLVSAQRCAHLWLHGSVRVPSVAAALQRLLWLWHRLDCEPLIVLGGQQLPCGWLL